jgi:hypothetical protein
MCTLLHLVCLLLYAQGFTPTQALQQLLQPMLPLWQ